MTTTWLVSDRLYPVVVHLILRGSVSMLGPSEALGPDFPAPMFPTRHTSLISLATDTPEVPLNILAYPT